MIQPQTRRTLNRILLFLIPAIIIAAITYYLWTTPSVSLLQSSQQGDIIAATIEHNNFSPAQLTIHKGQTIMWINNDSVTHTVTADNNDGPHSPELKKTDSYSDTFVATGTFPYHCSIHQTMKGVINVVE